MHSGHLHKEPDSYKTGNQALHSGFGAANATPSPSRGSARRSVHTALRSGGRRRLGRGKRGRLMDRGLVPLICSNRMVLTEGTSAGTPTNLPGLVPDET